MKKADAASLRQTSTWSYNNGNQLTTYVDRLGREKDYAYYDNGLENGRIKG